MAHEQTDASENGSCAQCLRVLLNQGSGGADDSELREKIIRLFAAEDMDATVEELTGHELAARVGEGFDDDIVVAAGGDGTVHLVASALLDAEPCLGVLPLGTVNLFARSLKIPLELEAAVTTISGGIERHADVCEVNGRAVFTNVSTGLYAEITADREQRRTKHRNWPRLLRWVYDTAAAFFDVSKYWWRSGMTLRVDSETCAQPAQLLTVSNSEYQGWAQAERRTDGKLCVLIPQPKSPLRTFWTAIQLALRGPRKAPDVDVRLAHQVEVLGSGRIKATIDGEVESLTLPLRIRPRRCAVRVRVPGSCQAPAA